MTRTARAMACWAGLGAAGLGLGACEVGPRSAPRLDSDRVREVWNPFAPERLRISPLTHLGRDAEGVTQIVAHIELRDADGLPVRGIGALQIELYRPRGGVEDGLAEQELRWDVDLSNLEENRVFFERATGTYRVPLVGTPAWVEARLEAWEAGDPGGRVHLVATLRTIGPRGGDRVLRDEFFIER